MRSENSVLAIRLPVELRREVEADAEKLGVSLSDAARIRLQTGNCPTLDASGSNNRGRKNDR
jgi:hypothetical protein